MNTPLTALERERAIDEENRRARELWVNTLSDEEYAHARSDIHLYRTANAADRA